MCLFADQLVRSPRVVDVIVDALENFVCVIVGHEDDPQRRSITGNRWRKLRGLPEIVPPYELRPSRASAWSNSLELLLATKTMWVLPLCEQLAGGNGLV
jgi:hypothetical protein